MNARIAWGNESAGSGDVGASSLHLANRGVLPYWYPATIRQATDPSTGACPRGTVVWSSFCWGCDTAPPYLGTPPAKGPTINVVDTPAGKVAVPVCVHTVASTPNVTAGTCPK